MLIFFWENCMFLILHFFLLLFSCSVMSDSFQHHGLQHARLPCPSLSPQVCSNSCQWWACSNSNSVMPSNHLIFCHCLLLLPSSFLRVFSNELALHIWWPKYWSFSFSISPSNQYSKLISLGIDWFNLCSPRDCQESSPTSQFKSTNSSALSHLYGPTLTSIHEYWKNHSFDYMDLCQKSKVFFLICCLGLLKFFFQRESIF